MSKDCPAGMVTSPPGAAGAGAGVGAGASAAGAGGGAGASIGAEPPPRPVKVNATTSLVLKVCTSPFTSKRRTAAVPPRYLPWTTLPLFSSKVSAAATLTKNNATAMVAKKRLKLRILPSLIADSQSHTSPNLPRTERYSSILLHWIRGRMEWLRERLRRRVRARTKRSRPQEYLSNHNSAMRCAILFFFIPTAERRRQPPRDG